MSYIYDFIYRMPSFYQKMPQTVHICTVWGIFWILEHQYSQFSSYNVIKSAIYMYLGDKMSYNCIFIYHNPSFYQKMPQTVHVCTVWGHFLGTLFNWHLTFWWYNGPRGKMSIIDIFSYFCAISDKNRIKSIQNSLFWYILRLIFQRNIFLFFLGTKPVTILRLLTRIFGQVQPLFWF